MIWNLYDGLGLLLLLAIFIIAVAVIFNGLNNKK